MFAKEEADLHSESPLSMRAKELSRNQKRMERVMQEIKNEDLVSAPVLKLVRATTVDYLPN